MKAKLGIAWKLIAVLVLVVVLSACGRERADVTIFILPPGGMDSSVAETLENFVQDKVGETMSVDLFSSPIFDLNKLMVEIAAGDNDIMVLPEEQFKVFAEQGGLPGMDDLFRPEDYPEGVLEAPNDEGKLEKKLYGVPVSKTEWLQSVGYKGAEMYAFIHPRAKDKDKAAEVLKKIMES
ncbi:Maltose-binding periplasmic proteins/domains [Chlamydia abortus]|uniref:Extracellular solute-binding protein n=1 Tax=Paenibacillus residui TaxID=629724 RepID=A0ABW3DFV3_9BACL|nr:hypothetical protein [Paenibacillus sp. 32O-W]SHE13135.1 Maltose-binding periplasmic proteins/domains [Chlamydia abortus]